MKDVWNALVFALAIGFLVVQGTFIARGTSEAQTNVEVAVGASIPLDLTLLPGLDYALIRTDLPVACWEPARLLCPLSVF